MIIDFWHPDLTEDEREALRLIYDLRNVFEGRVPAGRSQAYLSSSSRQEVPSGRIGAAARNGGLLEAFKGIFGGK